MIQKTIKCDLVYKQIKFINFLHFITRNVTQQLMFTCNNRSKTKQDITHNLQMFKSEH